MFLVRSLVLMSPAVAIGYREKGLRNRIGTVVLGGDLLGPGSQPWRIPECPLIPANRRTCGAGKCHSLSLCAVAIRKQIRVP